MKFDPHRNKERFDAWKEQVEKKGIEGINKFHTSLILSHVTDMERGSNTSKSSKKGARSYIRLNAFRVRMAQLLRYFEARGIKDIRKVTKQEVTTLFNDLQVGKIKRLDGKQYASVRDFVKDFKSFWNWLKKSNNKLRDVTEDLDSSKDEVGFVYFTKEDVERLLPYFTVDEQVRMWFMFDTIIRSPTELMNVKVSDLHESESKDGLDLTIRDETSKTYGRTIKLLLCSDSVKDYIKRNNLTQNDFLFSYSAPFFNRKLKKIASKVLGDSMSKGGKPFSKLTQYDFRHSGACYWRLGAYKSKIDALMYRGGWNNLEILNYYTKKLGMKDSIERSDLLVERDKHELEKEIELLKQYNKKLSETSSMLQEEQKRTTIQLVEVLNYLHEKKRRVNS